MKNFILILMLSSVAFISAAQDPQFSQYYQAPLYMNPGFTGTSSGHRMIVNHRLQWPNLPQAFSTYAVSYDASLQNIRSGVGLLLTNDKMGSAGWKSTTASVLYAYKIPLTEKLIFSPGLSFGYGTNGIDRSKLQLGDGLEYGGNSMDPKLNNIRGQQYWDFGSGFVMYASQLWFGASFMHINKPNLSLIGETSRLKMKSSVHGGMRLDISSNLRSVRSVYFTPSFIYTMQGSSFSQLDLGLNFHVDPISVGVWYRGKPSVGDHAKALAHNDLILFMGLYLKRLSVGYSYDFSLSQLQTISGGAHELSLTYEFANKKRKSKNKLIPCPAFYTREGLR